ncbi:MAG: hypothetical protein OK455_03565 [Thaumarchaeota archaeon]|nr:hypothetical protein [Nitrososphaerota archaeon]
MKLRQFGTVLGAIALIAVIYSPSSIGVSGSGGSGDGGTSPADTSQSGTSMFLSYLHESGYHVIVANESQQVVSALGGKQNVAYFLIGADVALTAGETQAVVAGYQSGRVSLLMAEGNATNRALLQKLGADVTGAAILDPSSPFQDKRVFTLDLALGRNITSGVIDIASPLSLTLPSNLHSVAATGASSSDASNTALGPRTVIAAGTSPAGSRALVITDSAPFTNGLFDYAQPQGGIDEKRFVSAMVNWVDPNPGLVTQPALNGLGPGQNVTIVLDNAHYAGPQPPKFQLGIPIGPLVTYALEQDLSSMNGYYNSFPSQVSGFLGSLGVHVSDAGARALVASILLISIYGAITKWFSPEKKGKDDQPAPEVERTIVAESRARLDFLQTSRSKSFYVATLAQLYEVLDSILLDEFGKGISSIGESDLAREIGTDGAQSAKRLFLSLARLHDYATGRRRFLFPPVLRWKALASAMTRDSEAFLNQLGITIAGEEQEAERQSDKEKVEYRMRERVRA